MPRSQIGANADVLSALNAIKASKRPLRHWLWTMASHNANLFECQCTRSTCWMLVPKGTRGGLRADRRVQRCRTNARENDIRFLRADEAHAQHVCVNGNGVVVDLLEGHSTHCLRSYHHSSLGLKSTPRARRVGRRDMLPELRDQIGIVHRQTRVVWKPISPGRSTFE